MNCQQFWIHRVQWFPLSSMLNFAQISWPRHLVCSNSNYSLPRKFGMILLSPPGSGRGRWSSPSWWCEVRPWARPFPFPGCSWGLSTPTPPGPTFRTPTSLVMGPPWPCRAPRTLFGFWSWFITPGPMGPPPPMECRDVRPVPWVGSPDNLPVVPLWLLKQFPIVF
jgi:hypothetical protein